MFARKTATKVKNGKVQQKNNHKLTPNYWNKSKEEIQIDIEKPGKGYKHFLKKRDIKNFLEILPNRNEIDIEFNAVLLARGSNYTDGWYYNGVIAICAWEKEMTREFNMSYFYAHKNIFDRLGVKHTIRKNYVICDFTENQIKAYLLLHILLHEIGHHHDRVNTKSKKRCSKGEEYAESYALKYEKIIWSKYFEVFPM